MTADGPIGRITLARPEKKNALDRVTADELAEALFALSEAPVRVVAIDGDGPDFCAGADLSALEEMLDAPRQQHIDDAKALAQDMFQALWSFVVCVIVTVVVSMATKPKPDSELDGLVYGLTKVPRVGNVPVYQKPLFWAGVVTVVFFVLNIYFW